MKTLIKLLLVTTLFVLPLFYANNVHANDGIKYESVNPKDGFKYGMKRFQEKAKLLLYSFSPATKADYYQELTNARLAELKYIIDNKDQDNFEVATKRYFTTAGQYAEFIKNKNLNDKKSGAIEAFRSHQPILEKLRDTFDPLSAQWRFVHDDINYLKEYTQSLEK